MDEHFTLVELIKSMKETLSKMITTNSEMKKISSEMQKQWNEFYECWQSQEDSTGDDNDEDLTVLDDGAGEAYSHDDSDDDCNCDDNAVVESDPVPADLKSTSELGKCAAMEEQLKLVNQKSDVIVYEVKNDAHKLFDESPKKETTSLVASLAVSPPLYVQIADIEMKQHLLVQEQQLWQQYANNGMQGRVGEGEAVHLTLEVLNAIFQEERKGASRRLRLNVLIFDPGGGAISLSASILRYANRSRMNDARRIFHIKSDPCVVLCNPVILVLISLLNGKGSTKLGMIATIVFVVAVSSTALEGSKEIKAAMQSTTMESMINKTLDSPIDDLTLMKEILKVDEVDVWFSELKALVSNGHQWMYDHMKGIRMDTFRMSLTMVSSAVSSSSQGSGHDNADTLGSLVYGQLGTLQADGKFSFHVEEKL